MSESSDAPDVVLAFVLALDIDSQIKELGVNAPLAEGEGGAAELDVPTVGEGGLVVMVVDAKTRNLVWIGAATATLRNGDDNDAKARLDYAVSGLLERFAQ